MFHFTLHFDADEISNMWFNLFVILVNEKNLELNSSIFESQYQLDVHIQNVSLMEQKVTKIMDISTNSTR